MMNGYVTHTEARRGSVPIWPAVVAPQTLSCPSDSPLSRAASMNRFPYVRHLLMPSIAMSTVFVITGCGRQEDPQASAMATDVPVSVTTVKRQRLKSSLSLVGTTSPRADVNVVSETQGTTRAVHIKVGSQVAAGTVLVQVDDEIPRSTRSAAEISFQKAQRDFQRAEELYMENSISLSQLDASRLALKAAENQMDIARRQLENTRIKSPISGTVNARYVEPGTMVQPGMAVVNIVDVSSLKVRVNVAEQEAFRLKPGEKVEITTDVYPGTAFEGTIDNIASKADEAHTYPVEVAIPNTREHPLKAGMFGRISFSSIAASEVLTIPREALVGSIKDPRVFVLEGNVARLRSIVVETAAGGSLGVREGLIEGERVVVNGQNNLRDSTSVLVVVEGARP